MTVPPPPGFRYREDREETAYSFLHVKFVGNEALAEAWAQWLVELGLPPDVTAIAISSGSAPTPLQNLSSFLPSGDHLARAYAVNDGAARGARIEFAFLDQMIADLLANQVSSLRGMPGFCGVTEDLRGLERVTEDDVESRHGKNNCGPHQDSRSGT